MPNVVDNSVPTVEEAVASMVGKAYGGVAVQPVMSIPVVVGDSDLQSLEKFDFDVEFQKKVLIHVLRDQNFMRKVGHLIKPEYFEDIGVASLANIGLEYFEKYNHVPGDKDTVKQLMRDALKTRALREDVYRLVAPAYMAAFGASTNLGCDSYVAEKVAAFARYQAVSGAIYKCVDMLEKKDYSKIERMIKMATEVGANDESIEYDYFAEIEARTKERNDILMGIKPPTGITTGHKMLDDLLYHKGWGRKELAVILGGPKSGKTTALINFAKAAAFSGFNVLYCTMEVSPEILAQRLDASISDIAVKELGMKMGEVYDKIVEANAKTGALQMHSYASGTCTPDMIRQLVQKYKSPRIMPNGKVREAIIFDMIVTDYADIMAPNHRTNDSIENSKSIYLDLRAIAQEENVAMLSATQSNREGAKAAVIKAENVADDYNKVRTVDIMISINLTEEERANGEARLFFAASRNQEGGFTIFIKQALAKMQFIKSILRIE